MSPTISQNLSNFDSDISTLPFSHKHTVAVDTSVVTLANLVGKTVDCVITIHGIISYDASDTITVVASVVGDSTNTASAAAFHKALAMASF